MSKALRINAAAAAILALAAAPAAAHVQVRPVEAAPEDPVLFEVLVPNEEDRPTVKVEVAVPPGVIPFSFAETPGWRRTTTTKPNGATRSIVWTGTLPPTAFARFSFLASTPTKEGTIAWKALQTYEGGEIVRWIGPPGSEAPAATTRISADVPRQNAGGEASGSADAPEESEQQASADAAPAASAEDDDGESDSTARILGAAGLVLGAVALGMSVLRRRRPT